jgi:hypothetical protein
VSSGRLCLDQSRRCWELCDELLDPAGNALLLRVPPISGVEVLRIGQLLTLRQPAKDSGPPPIRHWDFSPEPNIRSLA